MNDLDIFSQKLSDAHYSLLNALLIVREHPDHYDPFVDIVLEHIENSIVFILKSIKS